MTVTMELSLEDEARLQAEASRRGITVGQVVADLVAQLPVELPKHRLSFVGNGASGRYEALDLRQERAELAAKKLTEGF
jgi:hypothetical protein